MRRDNSDYLTEADKRRKGFHLDIIRDILTVITGVCLFVGSLIIGKHIYDGRVTNDQMEDLRALIAEDEAKSKIEATDAAVVNGNGQDEDKRPDETGGVAASPAVEEEGDGLSILSKYRGVYEKNSDVCGWLYIEGTVINYPVMQTPSDEEYYMHRDFYGRNNADGCLVMDTDSVVGVGNRSHNYEGGTAPSTNLIIHGHHLIKSAMFGDLVDYRSEEYGKAHSKICFDSLYEKREYELIAAFDTRVYNKDDQVFKYYNFFNAENEEEFNYFYNNIKKMSAYDTGVTAEFGDEFLTLSTCAYQAANGRFVVVAKRVK
ncbi:MAG: class B sortase [Lachnospiraceae bacterium]|nr:class B sortase [Lachnospiraceae bacterium]